MTLRFDRLRCGGNGQAHIRSRKMPADQLAFFEIQVAVLHDRRTFPVFENPFFAPQPVAGVRHIHRIRGAPGVEDLFTVHADHHSVAFDVLREVRIQPARHETKRDQGDHE